MADHSSSSTVPRLRTPSVPPNTSQSPGRIAYPPVPPHSPVLQPQQSHSSGFFPTQPMPFLSQNQAQSQSQGQAQNHLQNQNQHANSATSAMPTPPSGPPPPPPSSSAPLLTVAAVEPPRRTSFAFLRSSRKAKRNQPPVETPASLALKKPPPQLPVMGELPSLRDGIDLLTLDEKDEDDERERDEREKGDLTTATTTTSPAVHALRSASSMARFELERMRSPLSAGIPAVGTMAMSMMSSPGSVRALSSRASYSGSLSMGLPSRRRRRREPVAFNVLVLGTQNSGKTCFVNLLRHTLGVQKPCNPPLPPSQLAIERELGFMPHYVEKDSALDRVGITIWDSPALDSGANGLQLSQLNRFLESRFEHRFLEEQKVVRSPTIVESHIHVIFLLLDPGRLDAQVGWASRPMSAGLDTPSGSRRQFFVDSASPLHRKPDLVGVLDRNVDLAVIRALSNRALVIPIISKADTITSTRMRIMKDRVAESLAMARFEPLSVFRLLDMDDDSDIDEEEEEETDEVDEPEEQADVEEAEAEEADAEDEEFGEPIGGEEISSQVVSLRTADGRTESASPIYQDALSSPNPIPTEKSGGRDEPCEVDSLAASVAPSFDTTYRPNGVRPGSSVSRTSRTSNRSTNSSAFPTTITPSRSTQSAHPSNGTPAPRTFPHYPAHPPSASRPDLPFSVLSPEIYVAGAKVGREFPWGFADPFNKSHCDFANLVDFVFERRRAAIMEAGVKVWYEDWRGNRMGHGRYADGKM